jgi:hypothetical protein
MTSMTRAARAAAQLRQAVREIADLAAQRGLTEAQTTDRIPASERPGSCKSGLEPPEGGCAAIRATCDGSKLPAAASLSPGGDKQIPDGRPGALDLMEMSLLTGWLLSRAAVELDRHTGDRQGTCSACGQPWPCAPASAAAFVLDVF